MDEMKFPNKFVKTIYQANKILGKVESTISIILLWALIVVCMIFISCRFIFHYSTPWADELARYLLIILAWFGGSYAASVGDHLEIDIVSTVLKKHAKSADKILSVIDRIGQVIVLGVMVFFSYYFIVYMLKVNKMGVVSNTMGFKMVIPMALVLCGCFLIILHTIFNILLPREYWYGADKPAASTEDEEA
ncbi:TRAP transporter small permease [Dysosmobacter sp.]|uniref:TRAP transporter small permease n=1 Tax=Dysosmobacter sp. TaxID=2591382 RepID=UPI003A95D8F1